MCFSTPGRIRVLSSINLTRCSLEKNKYSETVPQGRPTLYPAHQTPIVHWFDLVPEKLTTSIKNVLRL